MPAQYYPIGIRQEIVDEQYAFLIVSPEKALCDLILATPNLRIQSVKAMREYLEEDLRFEMSTLQKFDIDIIRQCIEMGRKKGELGLLLELLNKLL